MFQKHPFLTVIFPAIVCLGTVLWLSLCLAGWPRAVGWCVTAAFVLFLGVNALQFWRQIIARQDRVPAKSPERKACARILKVFAIAMLSAYLGYATACGLYSRYPRARRWVRQQEMACVLRLHQSQSLSDIQLSKVKRMLAAYPPETHGMLGGSRYLFALISGMIAWMLASARYIPRKSRLAADSFYRGRRLLGFVEALVKSRKFMAASGGGLPWGGVFLPSEASRTGILLIGASGSGKTLSLRQILGSQLPSIRRGTDRRAFVYDGKRELLPYLCNMRLHCPVKILNPFDARSCSWHISADCTDPATALEIAMILFPTKGETQVFFINAAQLILAGVFILLHLLCAGKWTLRDVVIILTNPKLLRWLLGLFPETQHLVTFFAKDSVCMDIHSTIATRIAPYIPIAATWSHAKESISLRDWATNAYVVVLSTDESIRQSLDAINQVIFSRARELLLAQDDSDTRESWIVLDEVREMTSGTGCPNGNGSSVGLTSLLTKGRSFGVRTILGFQSMEGLRAAFGEKEANEIAGLCSNKAILRLDDAETAFWASKVFGEVEQYENHTSTGPNGKTTTRQLVKRDLVLPSEFLDLPATDRQKGLSGFFVSPYIGSHFATLTPEYLDSMLSPPNPKVPNFVPRPTEQQYLRPWTKADLHRLNLECLINADGTFMFDCVPSAATNRESARQSKPAQCDLKSVHRVDRHGDRTDDAPPEDKHA